MSTLPFRGAPPILSAKAKAVPIVATMFASTLPLMLPVIAEGPILPPLGLMVILAWRLLRPGLWAPWAPLPLGLFDDLASGQPLGSAMLSWTIAFLAIEASERTLIWRDYWQDWLTAALTLAGCIAAGYVFARLTGGSAPVHAILPQIAAAILTFPIVARLCAKLDNWRLR